MLDDLNAGKPQCPVNLNTLVVPRRRGQKVGAAARHLSAAVSLSQKSHSQPFVYVTCGHVQGMHAWGHLVPKENGGNSKHKCPICTQESDRILQITMGMEPAFHLDSGNLNYAFSPCGHVASLATVRLENPLVYWSNNLYSQTPLLRTSIFWEKSTHYWCVGTQFSPKTTRPIRKRRKWKQFL